MNNCIGLLVPKIVRSTQKRFTSHKRQGGTNTSEVFVPPRRRIVAFFYLTLSFIAKEFFMAQLVV